jgi:signal transduction histidine kinase
VDLMNDILDLARIEAGRVEIRRGARGHRAADRIGPGCRRPMAVKKGIDLVCNVDGPLPDAHLDPVRVKQILYNLLSNGIKFTPCARTGPPERHRGRPRAGAVGPGHRDRIRPGDRARLFHEFERIDPERGPKQEAPDWDWR